MRTSREIADWLAAIARAEFERQRGQVAELSPEAQTGLLVEACRVIDLHHVIHFMSNKSELGLSHFEFAIMLRGWNPLASLLLPYTGKLQGVPLSDSTPEVRERVLGILMNLGRVSLLRESAEVLRHGMAECTVDASTIRFRMSERCAIDHFLDRVEADKLRNLEDSMPGENIFKETVRKTNIENLDERIRELV